MGGGKYCIAGRASPAGCSLAPGDRRSAAAHDQQGFKVLAWLVYCMTCALLLQTTCCASLARNERCELAEQNGGQTGRPGSAGSGQQKIPSHATGDSGERQPEAGASPQDLGQKRDPAQKLDNGRAADEEASYRRATVAARYGSVSPGPPLPEHRKVRITQHYISHTALIMQPPRDAFLEVNRNRSILTNNGANIACGPCLGKVKGKRAADAATFAAPASAPLVSGDAHPESEAERACMDGDEREEAADSRC